MNSRLQHWPAPSSGREVQHTHLKWLTAAPVRLAAAERWGSDGTFALLIIVGVALLLLLACCFSTHGNCGVWTVL
jgi:hypothetical protein